MRSRRWTSVLVGIGLLTSAALWYEVRAEDAGSTGTADAQSAGDEDEASETPPALSPTRQLRRITLTLLNRPPTPAEYQQLLAVAEADRRAYLEAKIDEFLESDAFEQELIEWGFDYLKVGSYSANFANLYWNGHYTADLDVCEEGTLHAGAYHLINVYYGDPPGTCDDITAPLDDVEPWWAPGTTVSVLGSASKPDQMIDGEDCGKIRHGQRSNYLLFNGRDYEPFAGCGCGPNLLYCGRSNTPRFNQDAIDTGIGFWDGEEHHPDSQRRALFEEPARLFAHIITQDRPFSDIVIGDYTVVNQGLHHMYVRAARQNGHPEIDNNPWWKSMGDPSQWHEVKFADMNPYLLADRDYQFDPRVDDGQPLGVPAAGVLSTLNANVSFARERVRAARWLETFACRSFTPPATDVEFNPYRRDPAIEGVCQHCHQVIDPAAIHFKRIYDTGASIAGIGDWSITERRPYDGDRLRWEKAFAHDTKMTPVSQARIEANPDAIFLDFLPDDQSLFGLTSDGTIGPLGFGKMLVESGEFDRCTVQRTYERFSNRSFTKGDDAGIATQLAEEFVANGRSIKQLIRAIMKREEFWQGM